MVSSKKLGLRPSQAACACVALAESGAASCRVEYAALLGNSDGDVVVVANSCDAQQDGGYYNTFCNCANVAAVLRVLEARAC